MRSHVWYSIALTALLALGCSTAPVQSTNGLLTSTEVEAPGARCAQGGARLDFGLDANGNKTLDADEVDPALTQYVCNGQAGTPGTPGTTGGQGPAGPGGPAVVTTNAVELPGSNCQYGGVRVQFGNDVDGDLVLDPGEVAPALTQYVCNGTAGVDCYDLNANDTCDLGTEDKDQDGDCDVNDCQAPNVTNFIRNGTTPQTADFNVTGSGTTASLTTSELLVSTNTGQPWRKLLRVRGAACCPTGSGNATDLFAVDNGGGISARGELGVGIIPTTGSGTRMMWYPFKAAFRVGGVTGSNWDDANVGFYSFAGGNDTRASAFGTFAYGDQVNVSGVDAAAFGSSNTVSGTAGFSAGASNNCTGFGCIAMGFTNTASGQGSVALGYRTTADADYAVALGYRASANGHTGAIVFSDASTTDSVEASANNQFSARAAGGYRLFTNATTTTGVSLNAGGSAWNVISDRNAKTRIEDVDGEELLKKLERIPVQSWVYKDEVGQPRHIGPMAQDFRAAFGLGLDEVTINSLDLDGVNLAAAKALERRTAELAEKSKKVEALEEEVRALREELKRLARKVDRR